ncbi:MAG: inositol 2-dehydrogenase [Yoonia sp.]|uniref:inositol 2-dehydrogenase n=1 Tax=Halocynthiibacter sp. C4 TaxID=2992758 RepID=UPI00237A421F|nr:inositol 2-dehydrogenase [Halocynthiibacter sp. C4]MDE0591274.1 inositol 2-dehydrogenase [Halocynthiibacter sp. C4]MDG0989857.1 inositol 2-dehydrogenase [Yoonia sp.]MDG1866431.1 inositol 2-dehydrogenase [Yoonia sp.]
MTVKFAILGAGRIGQVHARAVTATPGATLVAIADPMADAAKKVAVAYGCGIRSIDEIAASDDVDAVAICTPTNTHADLIEQFAKAGKAVFCEKPVDLSLERVKSCLKTVEDQGGTLMVGFQRRFDPDFMALKKTIEDGRIGNVEMITLTSRDPGPPPYDYIKVSGGIFRDMTIHDFDVARWLLGEEVETVQAAASVLTDEKIGKLGDYDSINVILTTASGRQCTITNTRRATYGYDQRIEVHGSKGSVSAENHREANIEIADSTGYTRPPLMNFFMSRYVNAYANEIAAFVDAIANGSPTPTTGHDGMMALALADAALKSVAEGCVVKVSDLVATQ